VTDYGAPVTPAAFGGWLREQCDKTGIKLCSAQVYGKLEPASSPKKKMAHHHIS
jgi:hypothetical protein